MRTTQELLRAAAGAKRALALCGTEQKNKALLAAAASLRASAGEILGQNAKDLAAARGQIPDTMLDRLEEEGGRKAPAAFSASSAA